MATLTISLPDNTARRIDAEIKRRGFATRSEFVRAALRRVLADKVFLEETATFPFSPPPTKSVKAVMEAFKKEGKYSAKFLKDLEHGLRSSSHFKK